MSKPQISTFGDNHIFYQVNRTKFVEDMKDYIGRVRHVCKPWAYSIKFSILSLNTKMILPLEHGYIKQPKQSIFGVGRVIRSR